MASSAPQGARCWGEGLQGEGDPWAPKSLGKGFMVLVVTWKVTMNFFGRMWQGFWEWEQQELADTSALGNKWACPGTSRCLWHHLSSFRPLVMCDHRKGQWDVPSLCCCPVQPHTTSITSPSPTQLK